MTVNIKLNDKSIGIANKGKPKKKVNQKKIFVSIISIIIIILIILLCSHFFAEKTGIQLSITDVFKPIKDDPQLKKDSSGKYTNALLVGIDTRENNPGLQNTDTIILLSYNHESHQALLFSIPRDFFVEVPDQGRYTKINGIYAIGEMKEKGYGLEHLKQVVEEITNQEIQYYGMVNLSGFVDLIDTIGGIDVDVENSFTDYQYPLEDEEHRYQVVSFKKGMQSMDGITAIRFVRSRLSMDNNEGSDFARARRQQKVIIGLKDKILSSETLLNPQKALGILSIIEDNIDYSEFTNEEIQAVIKILKQENLKTYSFVLDPSLARFNLITDRGLALDAYVIGPIAGLSNYEEIHEYIAYACNNPLLYSEDPDILVYDIGLGYAEALEKAEAFQEKLPYIQVQFMGTLMKELKGNYLYKTTEDKNDLDETISGKTLIPVTESPEFMEQYPIVSDYIILLGEND